MKTLLLPLTFILLVLSLSGQDTTAPVITLYGQMEDTIEVYDAYPEPGYVAMDDVDGDLTSQVMIHTLLDTSLLGVFTIDYTVSDNAGNTGFTKRKVHVVDTQAPVLILNGDSLINLALNDQYSDPGITVTDNYDRSPVIIVGGTFMNSSTKGCYYVCYQAEDESGNSSLFKTRIISVDNGCTTFNYNICSSPSGIAAPVVPKVEIYPNPASDILIFKNLEQRIKAVDFINMQGKTMATGMVQEMTLKIPEYLNPGIYFLRIELNDQVVVKKQVIE